MTSTLPETPEEVGRRARDRVARLREREVDSLVRASLNEPEPTGQDLDAPEEPPATDFEACLFAAPWYPLYDRSMRSLTWEQAQAAEAAEEPWSAIGERLAASPVLTLGGPTRRMPTAAVSVSPADFLPWRGDALPWDANVDD